MGRIAFQGISSSKMRKVKNLIYRAAPQSHFAGVVSQATSLFVTAATRETVFSQ
jgi:hypothetical protein